MASAALTPQSALIEAKPPVTDYLTYLTIIEYNLSHEVLPTLEGILRDDLELVLNVGWDLVQLLCPLVPDSSECLQVIARRGNPKEVALKVTEALRLLDFAAMEDADDSEDDQPASVEGDAHPSARVSARTQKLNSLVTQFQTLLAMLAALHPRIKTKYPSRFLATSLQAVLVAYQRAGVHSVLLTDSILAFVKALSGSKRPQLPPRTSSGNVLSSVPSRDAADPAQVSDPVAPEEAAMQTRLLQSFITHVLEDFMLSLRSPDDVPGLAWSSRYMERTNPARIPNVPGKTTFAERFASEESLAARTSTLGQIVAIAQDLNLLGTPELLQLCLDTTAEGTGHPNREDEPPDSVEDIPLSKTGALFLVAATMARRTLFDAGGPPSPITIFAEHETIIANFISDPASVGLENEALLDTILFLALVSLEHNRIGEPASDEHFMKYLQTTALISANCPSPTLRYHAHYLTSTVLRSHPSDLVRLTFIRDTLEHCPYENLKASAVGWLKGETIEANLVPLMQAQGQTVPSQASSDEENIFATPVALTALAPYLFGDITVDIGPTAPIADAWVHFKTNMTLYLTTLNFYYFLLKAKPLHHALDVKSLHSDSDIGGSFLSPIAAAVERFDKDLIDGPLESEEGQEADAVRAELGLFSELIDNIKTEVAVLNQE